MTKVKTATLNILINPYLRKTILNWFLVCLSILVMIYFYFISSIVFNVVSTSSLINKNKSLNTQISEFEIIYLTNLDKIDKNYAKSLGFVESSNNLFVTRYISQIALR
jgi:hypothetical protein